MYIYCEVHDAKAHRMLDFGNTISQAHCAHFKKGRSETETQTHNVYTELVESSTHKPMLTSVVYIYSKIVHWFAVVCTHQCVLSFARLLVGSFARSLVRLFRPKKEYTNGIAQNKCHKNSVFFLVCFVLLPIYFACVLFFLYFFRYFRHSYVLHYGIRFNAIIIYEEIIWLFSVLECAMRWRRYAYIFSNRMNLRCFGSGVFFLLTSF